MVIRMMIIGMRIAAVDVELVLLPAVAPPFAWRQGLRGSAPEVLDAIAYTSTKGAVIAFTRDLAVKWARHGIRVNAIAPGWFDTDLSHAVIERSGETLLATIPMRRLGGDTDLAGAVAYLASPASAYVTGQTLVVDGGVSA